MASNLFDIYSNVDKKSDDRNANDFYPTAPLATYVLCKYGNVPKNILEPCAGRGNISIELQRNGHIVTSTDLNTYDNCHVPVESGVDVLGPKVENIDGMVTNPPYFSNLPLKIALHSINNYDYTAMLVRLTYFEGKRRKKLFAQHPPSQIIFLSDRLRFGSFLEEPIEMGDQIGGMIAYCWCVWSKNSSDQKLKWVLLEEEYDEWREKYDTWVTSKTQ